MDIEKVTKNTYERFPRYDVGARFFFFLTFILFSFLFFFSKI